MSRPTSPALLPIARPALGEEEAAAAREAILSGWVTQGPRVAAFEEAFARTVGATHCCAVSSGTAALHLALLAAGTAPGDVVITVSHSFIATANAVRHCGAEPVFVDIDPATLNIDPEHLRSCLETDFERRESALWYRHVDRLARGESPLAGREPPFGRLAAILVVHQVGMPADLARILPLARAHGIPVIEDAACAIGSEVAVGGRWAAVGAPHGDLACFSMHPRKVITTGDGGMITTNDARHDARLRLLRQHGMDTPDYQRHRADGIVVERYVTTAYNYRMTDIQAAVGLVQLTRLPGLVSERRRLAALYAERLAPIQGLQAPAEPAYARTNWQSYVVTLAPGIDTLAVMAALKARGVDSRRGVMCAHLETPYSAGWPQGCLPQSERARDRGIVLPLFPGMTGADVDRVATALAEALAQHDRRVDPTPRTTTGPTPGLAPYAYCWPREPLRDWQASAGDLRARAMPESEQALAADSRWPGFFPSPLCIVTTGRGSRVAVEKVVGASIVNRFPYVVALSFCVRPLSARHHPRTQFVELLEQTGRAVVQFLAPGPALDDLLRVILASDDAATLSRLERARMALRPGAGSDVPMLQEAYLAYEAKLVEPGRDVDGRAIHSHAALDVGSHRVYFLEIDAISLRSDIAHGRTQIAWRSLPEWRPQAPPTVARSAPAGRVRPRYDKGYTPHYRFPAANTIAFAPDLEADGHCVKRIHTPSAAELAGLDNDGARWPCFFPSSLGLITTRDRHGVSNLMPCGSTSVVSRHPLTFAICVAYCGINERYAPRASLAALRSTGRFVCGVPYIDGPLVEAIRYAGSVSIAQDEDKLRHTGLPVEDGAFGPILTDLPLHYECEITCEIALGTHAMFLGEVRRILARPDVRPDNPLVWFPWADLVERDG